MKIKIFKHFEKLARLLVKDNDQSKVTIKTFYLSQLSIRIIELISFLASIFFLIALGGYLGTIVPIYFVSVFVTLFGTWLVVFQVFLFMELKIKHLELKKFVSDMKYDLEEIELAKKYREERLLLQKKAREEDPDGYDDEEDEVKNQ